MVAKADQARLCALMREAVSMLCKTGLSFETKFCVEGLLGITVDDKDIMLININETILKYENLDSGEDYHSTSSNSEIPRERDQPVILEGDPVVEQGQLQIDDLDSTDSLIMAHVENNTEPPAQAPRRARKHKHSKQQRHEEERQIEEHQIEESQIEEGTLTEVVAGDEKNKSGFFSPTVDQIIQEYEQQQYSDSSSLLYMARKRRRKYPDHVTELHTRGLLPILPQPEAVISIVPTTTQSTMSLPTPSPSPGKTTLAKQPGQAPPQKTKLILTTRAKSPVPPPPPMMIKKEPGLVDAAEKSSGVKRPVVRNVEPILIQPTTEWTAAPSNSRSKALVENNTSAISNIASNVASSVIAEDTLWIEDAILKQDGCFVSTRVILRKHGTLRGDNVTQAMRNMTHQRGNPLYVGEFRASGRIQVFYKCPPVLLSMKALQRYNMNLDQYSNHFFGNPKPNNGTPSQWTAYINTVLEGIPYSPKLFPIESMNLVEEEFKKLSFKRDMLSDQFIGVRSDDSVLGGFKMDDREDGTTASTTNTKKWEGGVKLKLAY